MNPKGKVDKMTISKEIKDAIKTAEDTACVLDDMLEENTLLDLFLMYPCKTDELIHAVIKACKNLQDAIDCLSEFRDEEI